MKKTNIIAIILSIITACAVLLVTAFLNADKILMNVSPKLYMGYLASNTAKKLEDELEKAEDAAPDFFELSDSHSMTFSGNINGNEIQFEECFDDEIPQIYINGSFTNQGKNLDFISYINNDETGVCFPSLLDVYFTLPSKNLGEAFSNSMASQIIPITLPKGISADFLTEDSADAEDYAHSVAAAFTPLIEKAKIKSEGKGKYILTADGASYRTALSRSIDLLARKISYSAKPLEYLGADISAYTDMLKSEIENAKLDDGAQINFTSKHSRINSVSTSFESESGKTEIKIIASDGARLTDSIAFSIITESETGRFGFGIKNSGNRIYPKEGLSSDTELEIYFGDETALKLENSISYTPEYSFTGNCRISAPIFANGAVSADYSGVADKVSTELNIEEITANGESIGNAKISISDFTSMNVPQKDCIPINDISPENAKRIMDAYNRQ